MGLYIGTVNNNFVRFGVESNWMSEKVLFSVCEYMGGWTYKSKILPFLYFTFHSMG
jgi:hypothetical protein